MSIEFNRESVKQSPNPEDVYSKTVDGLSPSEEKIQGAGTAISSFAQTSKEKSPSLLDRASKISVNNELSGKAKSVLSKSLSKISKKIKKMSNDTLETLKKTWVGQKAKGFQESAKEKIVALKNEWKYSKTKRKAENFIDAAKAKVRDLKSEWKHSEDKQEFDEYFESINDKVTGLKESAKEILSDIKYEWDHSGKVDDVKEAVISTKEKWIKTKNRVKDLFSSHASSLKKSITANTSEKVQQITQKKKKNQ